MTRNDNERIAVLETEMGHMRAQLEAHRVESKASVTEANIKLDKISASLKSWEDQASGGKWVLGFLVTLGGLLGGGTVWLLKIWPWAGLLPR